MKTQLPLSLLSLSFTTFLLLLLHPISAAARHSFSTSTTTVVDTTVNDTDFIRTSCETTQYPEICYNSLAGYSEAVQQDPAKLASVAINVSLSEARAMAVNLSNICHQADPGSDPRSSGALRDCVTVFGDAVYQMRRSRNQMSHMGGSAEEIKFELSDVQTWMSAALTNEETCTDGFEGVLDGPMKTDVCDGAVKVKEVTSNALALINSYAAKVT